jgi:predicted nucleotidyltransferase
MPAESEPLAFGLKPAVIKRMQAVLAAFPQVEQAILYGSRAKGNFKNGSDIDLCLVGPSLTLPVLLNIDNALDDLLLPYKIDLSLHHHLDNAELRAHIARVGVGFYRKESEAGAQSSS